jgi:hypothetical protein
MASLFITLNLNLAALCNNAFPLQSLQERRFDDICAVYHLLNDKCTAASSSSSSIASELSTSASAWSSLSDSQHLEKVILVIFSLLCRIDLSLTNSKRWFELP